MGSIMFFGALAAANLGFGIRMFEQDNIVIASINFAAIAPCVAIIFAEAFAIKRGE